MQVPRGEQTTGGDVGINSDMENCASSQKHEIKCANFERRFSSSCHTPIGLQLRTEKSKLKFGLCIVL